MFSDSLLKRTYSRIPWQIIISLFLIVALGMLNLFSAAQSSRPDLYISQGSKFILAFALCLVVTFTNPILIKRLAFLGYLGAVFLLLLVLLVGTEAKGGQRWLVFAGFRLQPSDPAKIALIVALADYCSKYWPHGGFSLTTLIRPLNISRPLLFLLAIIALLVKEKHAAKYFSMQLLTSKTGLFLMLFLLLLGVAWLFICVLKLKNSKFNFQNIIAPIDLPLSLFFLIAIEPDLGTGLVILSIAGLMFLYVGIKKWSIIIGLISLLFIGVGGYFTLLKDYQKDRVISFLNPEGNKLGKSYQSVQSIIAIGSGKLLGKGFREGTQTQLSFLPENSTDFVFSVWAEEWGFWASVFLLALYLFLLRNILRLTLKVEDQFSKLLCVGIACNIFVHVMINVGMVTGLLPVVGVPLVLMSYGGSAMNTTLIGIGLVLNIAIWRGVK